MALNHLIKRRVLSAGLKSLLAVGLLCLAVILYLRHQPELLPTGEPRIEFDSESYDFGTIFQMRQYECAFKLRNSGTADLIIENVSATCGCTAALLSDEIIEPGGEGEIKVTFKSGTYSRTIRKPVRVRSNDPEEPLKTLYVKATVVPRLILKPQLLHLKGVHRKEGATKSIIVKPSENEDVSSIRVKFVGSRSFSAKLERVSVVENEYRVSVSVRKNLPIGRVSGKMEFYINEETEPCARLRALSATIVGDITVSPNRLVFRTKLESDDEIKPITLTSTASEPLQILSVKSDVPGLKVEASPVEEGKSVTIVGRLAPDAQRGSMRGNITVRTNNADQSEITVPVRGTVQ